MYTTSSNELAEEQFIKYHEKPGKMVSQKASDNSPEAKLKVMEYCDLIEKSK